MEESRRIREEQDRAYEECAQWDHDRAEQIRKDEERAEVYN